MHLRLLVTKSLRLLSFLLLPIICGTGAMDAKELILVEDGISRAPIIIPDNAPPLTLSVAGELADYIEKTSGARPEIIVGPPDPLPPHAIWVDIEKLCNDHPYSMRWTRITPGSRRVMRGGGLHPDHMR